MSHDEYRCKNTPLFILNDSLKNELKTIIMHVYVQTFILLMMVDSPWIRFKYIFFKKQAHLLQFKKNKWLLK